MNICDKPVRAVAIPLNCQLGHNTRGACGVHPPHDSGTDHQLRHTCARSPSSAWGGQVKTLELQPQLLAGRLALSDGPAVDSRGAIWCAERKASNLVRVDGLKALGQTSLLSQLTYLGVTAIDPRPVESPLLVNLIGGTLFEPSARVDRWKLPCADSPIFLIDRALVEVAR